VTYSTGPSPAPGWPGPRGWTPFLGGKVFVVEPAPAPADVH